MEIVLNILGYGFITVVILLMLYVFFKILKNGFVAISKDDD